MSKWICAKIHLQLTRLLHTIISYGSIYISAIFGVNNLVEKKKKLKLKICSIIYDAISIYIVY